MRPAGIVIALDAVPDGYADELPEHAFVYPDGQKPPDELIQAHRQKE